MRVVSTSTENATHSSTSNGELRGLPEGFEAQDWGPGKSVIITGGTTGIGRALALLLGSRGAQVTICGRHQEELDDALAALEEHRAAAHRMVAHLSKPSGCE